MESPKFSVDLKFKDDYKVNHGIIDQQHEKLFTMAGEIINLHLQNSGKDEIVQKLRTLYITLEENFVYEEEIMEATEYPNKQEHQHNHYELLIRTARFLARYEAEAISLGDLYSFLHGAIVQQHFLLVDKQFTDFLQKKCD